MGADTYYVTITTDNGSGMGCVSSPVEVVINDVSEEPEITFAQSSNTACDLDYADGSLTATATTDKNPVGAGSTFEWFVGPAGTTTSFVDAIGGDIIDVSDHVSRIENVKPGSYTVKVTDQLTGCSFGLFIINL